MNKHSLNHRKQDSTSGSVLTANKAHLSLRFLLVLYALICTAMLVVAIYPFNFFPSNHVQWLSKEPGLYFNGKGIACTGKAELIPLGKAVSIELLLKERIGSKNWGPREIFSFYDGSASPSLLVGQWDGRIFMYCRFESNESDKWYRIFRTKERFARGETQLVTVTFGAGEKAIYINGQLNNRKKVQINDTAGIKFSGRFLLGNSPRLRNGWWGEIKGLAIYTRVLLPEEIATHNVQVIDKGMSGLAKTPGCMALYPFNEGKGNTTKSILGKSRPFFIPRSKNALAGTLFSLPNRDMRIESFPIADFLQNIIFFIPFGILLTAIILKKYAIGYFVTFLIVTFAGGLFSYLIEFLQLFLPTRSSGLSDVFGNILGSSLGLILAFTLTLKRCKASSNS